MSRAACSAGPEGSGRPSHDPTSGSARPQPHAAAAASATTASLGTRALAPGVDNSDDPSPKETIPGGQEFPRRSLRKISAPGGQLVVAAGLPWLRKKKAKSRITTKDIAAGHSQIAVQSWTTVPPTLVAYMSTMGPEIQFPMSIPTP